MADDQVRIDPEFQPPPPSDGQGRWLRVAGIVAVGVVAFILGWLLRSPSPAESEPDEEAATSSTALTGETVVASPTTRPSTTTTEPPEMVGLEVPLGEAVPGFTDTVTMMVWSDAGIDLMRWWPSQTAPETIVSFDHDEPGFAGLDASGTWYAVQDENGVLSVRPVTGVVDEPWGWPPAFREAVGLRVAASAWHDTDPGRLAWLSCSRTPDGPSILYTLDVTDGTAEPVPIRKIEDACGENSGVWLGGWGDWGFELGRWARRWEGERHEQILLDADGTEIATLGDDFGETFFVGGSGGTIWTDDPLGPGASSFLLSLDGQRRDPVPGLADDEWVDEALWSPDGTRLALSPRHSEGDDSVIRIVEAATGAVIDEITEPENEVWPRAWSRDGRFLLYESDVYESDDGWGPSEVDWVVYDTATGVATELSVPEGQYLGEIRTSEPVPVAEQFTPVEWGIDLDEESWGPGVHTVFMEVDARPLLPGQVEGVSGKLIWDETVVELCNIGMDDVGNGSLHIGDTFQTIEGCGTNPTAMQDAFDEYGLPETACLAVRVDGLDHEYCAPLASGSPDDEIAAAHTAYPLLTVEDLPGEWHEAGTDAQFLLPEGLCSQIPTGQDIFPDTERPDSPSYSMPLAQARFVRAESSTWLNQGMYASGYTTGDQLFTQFKTLLTDCSVETEGAVTTDDQTGSIDLVDLPGLERDYVAVEWRIVRAWWSSEKTRVAIVHLGDVLILIGTRQEWWSPPDESLGVSDAEFEAIVQTAVARASSLTNG